jgi:phospholipid transport system substrate-binding protein
MGELVSMRISVLLRTLVLAAAIAAPSTVLAETTAQNFVKGKQTELVGLLKQKSPSSSKKIESIFDEMLDYDSLARSSLQDQWDTLTEAQRKEFRDVLKQLVQRAYRKNLDKTANYDVRFEGESKAKDGFVVKTVATHRSNARDEPVSIDYVVHRVDGAWRVNDIVTEGSSLVTNYRRQFSRVIKKDGFDELMRRMKKKLAE